jgi:hypothetical protein
MMSVPNRSRLLVTLLIGLPIASQAQVAPSAPARAEATFFYELGQFRAYSIQLAPDPAPPFEKALFLDGTDNLTLAPVGLYTFVNDVGRVRAFASTGTGGGEAKREGEMVLMWRKTFRKVDGSPNPTFTVNVSTLEMHSPKHFGIAPLVPYASFFIGVTAHFPDMAQAAPRYLRHSSQLWHEAKVSGTDGIANGVEQTLEHGQIREVDVVGGPLRGTFEVFGATGFYETQSYTGVIDVSAVSPGKRYTVEYYLVANAGNWRNEAYSEAFVGDPLDADSGFILNSEDEPADDDAEPFCDSEPDDQRYGISNDGTVTDRYTGLMWQRCPTGFSLGDNGTPSDLTDDECVVDGDPDVTWQQALQQAAADSSAAHLDWRLPNIKELDSIVELACHSPAIAGDPFPDTPQAPFWSGTPGQAAAVARIVDFARGDLGSAVKSEQTHARLVRTSGQAPLQPLPAVYVGRANAVTEADSGTTPLVFAIALDRPSSSDTTLSYETADVTATAGTDYVTTAGTVTIPAGSQRVEVIVPVVADALGEPDEVLSFRVTSVSASARLVIAENVGEIDDNEPLISIAPGSVSEGDAGTTTLSFDVSLDRPADADVAVDYATSNVTATAGADYTAKSGTLAIPAGSTTGTITVSVTGDQSIEGDESFIVTLSGVSANARLSSSAAQAQGTIVDDDTATLRALNDTGLTLCADATSGGKSCAQTAVFPGQDAQFGRDATNNGNTDGDAGFSFTKLDASGVPLANQAAQFTVTPWDCVRDEVTGLQWEVKTDNGGLRDKDWTYSWFNSTGVNDGGSAGTANGGACVDTSNCDTEKYVSAVNAAGLCGRNDWRLPTREELQSIVNISQFNTAPRYDIDFFPNPPPSLTLAHWTSTPDASSAAIAWTVDVLKGRGSAIYSKSREFPVFLVRAGN